MGIFKYKVLNPVVSNKKPFFDKSGFFVIPNLKTSYRYFVEAIVPHENGTIEYFFLLGKVKFDVNCRICNTDNYGRVKIKVKGDMREFINNELEDRGNLDIDYIESIDNYDVFRVH